MTKKPREVFVEFDQEERDFHVVDAKTLKSIASGFSHAHKAHDYVADNGHKIVRRSDN